MCLPVSLRVWRACNAQKGLGWGVETESLLEAFRKGREAGQGCMEIAGQDWLQCSCITIMQSAGGDLGASQSPGSIVIVNQRILGGLEGPPLLTWAGVQLYSRVDIETFTLKGLEGRSQADKCQFPPGEVWEPGVGLGWCGREVLLQS